MIYCCGIMHTATRVITLKDNDNFVKRKLEIMNCPVCNALKVRLSQFNIKKNISEIIIPKRKKTADFIKFYQNSEWSETVFTPVNTSKSNCGFIFGINKEYKNGVIKQFASDFNNNKTLVKVIKHG